MSSHEEARQLIEARRLLETVVPYSADTQAVRRQFVLDRAAAAMTFLAGCDTADPDELIELICDAQCELGKAVVEITKASLR